MSKVIIVTGASSKLGENLVAKLLENGHKVFALARNKDSIKIDTGNLVKISADLVDTESLKNAFEEIRKKEEKPNVLINLAGATVSGSTLKFSDKDFKNVLEVNVLGVFNMIKYFVESHDVSNTARIINITSMTGYAAFPNFGLYSASKHAEEALGLSLRYELIGKNIIVTNIAPGAIEKKETKKEVKKRKTAREKFGLLKILLPIQTSDSVAQEIVKVVEISNPPARLILGRDAKIVYLLQKLLPFSLFDRLMIFVWSKK